MADVHIIGTLNENESNAGTGKSSTKLGQGVMDRTAPWTLGRDLIEFISLKGKMVTTDFTD